MQQQILKNPISIRKFSNPASDKIIVEFDGFKEVYTVLGKEDFSNQK